MKREHILRLIFLISTLLATLLLIFLYHFHKDCLIFFIGCIFVLCGVVSHLGTKGKFFLSYVFLILGTLTIFLSFNRYFGNSLNIDYHKLLPRFILLVFMGIGFYMSVFYPLIEKYRKQKYYYKVLGQIIGIEDDICNGSVRHAPVYAYQVDDKYYTYTNEKFSVIIGYKVGDIQTLYINKTNPEDVLYTDLENTGVMIFIGTMFILTSFVSLLLFK